MRWCYDPLCSFQVIHPKQTAVDPDNFEDLPAPFFEITPAPATLFFLQRYGWVFKPAAGGGDIYLEKYYRADQTKAIRFPLDTAVAFDFLVKLQMPELLDTTKPFKETFPEFSGRRQILYFDNKMELSDPAADVIQLSAQTEVSLDDFASLAPENYTFPAYYPQIEEILLEYTPAIDNNPKHSIKPNANSPTVQFNNIPPGAWQLSRQPENKQEILYLDSRLLGEQFLGLIRILKKPDQDWDRYRKYKLSFSLA